MKLEDTAKKERPILFSGAMVRAILAGRKTQTRRLVKPALPDDDVLILSELPCIDPVAKCVVSGSSGIWEDERGLDLVRKCPYGATGGRLWVREKFKVNGTMAGPKITYCADGATKWFEDAPEGPDWIADDNHWRPSIFMRPYASRLLLEVVQVRVERLQAITEADAKAEGVTPLRYECKLSNGGTMDIGANPERNEAPLLGMELSVGFGTIPRRVTVTGVVAHYVEAYAQLWDEINGAGSWAKNPWVWVVEFRSIA